jgi:glycosyltransferase involved in cell wall biosynthesis
MNTLPATRLPAAAPSTNAPPVVVSPALSILQLRSSAGLYGADQVVLTLAQALAREPGVRSRLLSISNYRMPRQPLHEAAMAHGQDAALLPCRGRLDLRTVAALAAEAARFDADVLHAHDYKSAFYAWRASRRRQTLLVATLHGWTGGSRALRFYHRLELALLRRFDALVVVAANQRQPLLQAGVPSARIHQVDNAIAPPAATSQSPHVLRAALGLPAQAFVFAAVARLSPEKNLAMLVDVFHALAAEHADVMLLVVGDGPQRADLEAQVRRMDLGTRVHFAGSRDDMQRIYPAVDCLVLPSLTEGMPLVVLEAMAHALPVVASAVGEVPRLLSHAAHGRTVAPGVAAELLVAMRAAASQPGLRDPQARDYVLREHGSERMADAYLAIYRSLLEQARGRAVS